MGEEEASFADLDEGEEPVGEDVGDFLVKEAVVR